MNAESLILSEREVAGHVLAALVAECVRAGSGPHNKFIALRIGADGDSQLFTLLETHRFVDIEDLAEWLVTRCRAKAQPEAATAGA